jgi:ankyrin repeat protein
MVQLLDHGADVEGAAPDGKTALMLAASSIAWQLANSCWRSVPIPPHGMQAA